MEITREHLLQEIDSITKLRDDFLSDAQRQISTFNGGIRMAETLLEYLDKPGTIAENGEASAAATTAPIAEDGDGKDGHLAAVSDSVQNQSPAVVTEEEPDAPAGLHSSADTTENSGQARVHIAESGEAGQLDILSPETAMNAGTHRQE
jgi:hypothetical protein